MPQAKMHSLLTRQLKKNFGDSFAAPREWLDFIDMVNRAYHEADIDRGMLERSLELSSQELLQTNSGMRAIFEAVPDIFFRIDASGIILDCKTGNLSDLIMPREEMIGKNISDIPLISVAQKFRQALTETRQTNTTISFEYSLLLHNKDNFYEARLIPLLEEQAIVIIRNITDRKEAEKALKKSEEIRLRLVDAIPDVIVRSDLKGKVVYVNDYALKISGYSRDDMEGHNIIEFIVPSDRWRLIENARVVLEQRLPPQEYKLRLKDKSEKIFEVNGNVLRNEDGTPFGFVHVCRDISERQRTEKTLRETENLFRLITDNIRDTVWLMDINLQTTWISPSVERTRGYTLEELQMLSLEQHLTAPSYQKVMELIAKHLTPEKLATPREEISVEAELEFYRKDGSSIWADTVVTMLRDAQGAPEGFLCIARDTTERRKMENELRESENKYRLLTEKMTDIVWIADLNLRVLYVTPSIQAVLGFTQEERIQQTIEQTFTPDSIAYGLEVMAREFGRDSQGDTDPKRTVSLILEHYHKNGSTRWMETTISGLRNDHGVLTGLHGVSRDISEQKRAQEELRQSENKFRLLTERTSDIVWTADMNLKELYVSPSVQTVLGFSPEERLRQRLDQQMTPASLSFAIETMARELAHEKQGLADPSRTVTIELEYYHKDGSTRWMETVITGIRNYQGVLFELYGVSRDITKRKKMEEALRQSEEKYRLIAENTGELITVSDMNLKFTYISPSIMRTHGLTVEEAMNTPLEQFMTPPSLQKLFDVFAKQLEIEATGNFDPGRIIVLEVEEFRKDGSTIWLESSISALRDSDNQLIGILTVSRDITDRKRAEEALRLAHTELEQRVAERTYELTAANTNLKELFEKQEINIDLAKNILAMINYRPHRHKQLPDNIEMFFTACYLPCYAEGGDHFFIKDFSEMRPGIAKTAISLKDQSGHEVSCILRSIITDLIHNALLVQTPDLPIAEIITRLNKEICELPFFGDDNFFTSVDAEINHKNLKMRYVSSGHPPFLFIRGRDVVCLPSLESQARNLPIGVFQSVDFMSGEIQLQKGDKMIFFTDGLTDLPHMSGQPVLNAEDMKDMVSAIVKDEPGLSVSLLMARLFNRINGQEGDSLVIPHSLYDDITLMGVELENGNYDYEDIVRPQNIEDMDNCVNQLFQKISEEWKERGFSLPETRLRMVLDEAMVNAWTHGNREDPQKMIVVRRRYGNDAVLEVIDEGNGFDYKTFYDPTCKDNLLKPRGRGNFIMRLLTEETQWKNGGRHLISYFAREYQTERTIRPFSGFNLWRKLSRS